MVRINNRTGKIQTTKFKLFLIIIITSILTIIAFFSYLDLKDKIIIDQLNSPQLESNSYNEANLIN